MNRDKAGKAYWDRLWEGKSLPPAVDPRARGLGNFRYRKFDELFRTAFLSITTKNGDLLEMGCAASRWLPYFAKEFGFKVHGIDYSETGCRQAERILSNEGVKGEIEYADIFSPPSHMLGAFDVVVSFGVAEHFEDTTDCISMFSAFLKPGGLMVTVIPNMVGGIGAIHKIIDRPVFEAHVPLDREALSAAHEGSGLEVAFCDYFMFASALINFERWRGTRFYAVFTRIRALLDRTLHFAESTIPLLKPNHWTSPYVVCVARKPCA